MQSVEFGREGVFWNLIILLGSGGLRKWGRRE